MLREFRPEVFHIHTTSGLKAVDFPGQCYAITFSTHFFRLGDGLRGGTVSLTGGFNSEPPDTTFGVSRGFGAGTPPDGTSFGAGGTFGDGLGESEGGETGFTWGTGGAFSLIPESATSLIWEKSTVFR